MYTQGLLGLVPLLFMSSLFILLPAISQSFSLSLRSGLGSTSSCRLSQSESERRCRIPGGKLCSGRGQCDCGVCICQVTEPGKYYGPLCECHDWVCETYDGETCAVPGCTIPKSATEGHINIWDYEGRMQRRGIYYANDVPFTGRRTPLDFTRRKNAFPHKVFFILNVKVMKATAVSDTTVSILDVLRKHAELASVALMPEYRATSQMLFVQAGHGKCDCGKCKCEDGWYGDACQYPMTCNLTRKKSNEMCKNSQDIVCSNAGTCHCGRCKCDNLEGNGLIHGKHCECDDRECIDEETGEMCTGHGKCYCGNCYCEAGWHGDKCELQCDITPWEIKRRCTSPGGKICSNRGTCICGECTCHDVDPTGDWGDIHGDTCECDERNCKGLYDRYSDDFCSGHGQCNCGRCDCKPGWTGKKCEHSLSCHMSAEESARKCQGSSHLPCSGRGNCECGQCTCFPPGESKIYGKICECDDRQCEDIDGNICNGHGICSCGRCVCKDGWFGKLCQHPRKCTMTENESRIFCESADGILCSEKGSCHCGKCICSPQEWYITGEFCECDDRDCDKHDGLICTGNGICSCGNCECWEGWTGNACEIWLVAEYP